MMFPANCLRTAPLAALLAIFGTAALAQSRAVESANFELGLESTDSDTSGSTSIGMLGLNGGGTLPVGEYFGFAFSGYYTESKVRTGDVLADTSGAAAGNRPSCGFDSLGGDVTAFARRPWLGKAGLTYGKGKLSPKCGGGSVFIAGGDDKLDTEHYRVDVEAYLGDFTLAAAHISTDLGSTTLDSNEVSASWYPFDSLKASLVSNDLYDQDYIQVMLEHQPEFMGDAFGLRLGYSQSDRSPKTSTVYLGMTYYFGSRVTLKDRDRHYR